MCIVLCCSECGVGGVFVPYVPCGWCCLCVACCCVLCVAVFIGGWGESVEEGVQGCIIGVTRRCEGSHIHIAGPTGFIFAEFLLFVDIEEI